MLAVVAHRFWSKTKPQSGCIEWVGARATTHGRFRTDKRIYVSSRYIYEQALGAIPPGKVVMHTCDNGLCVKLQHLDIGTQKQNIQDASAKGRMVGNRTTIRPFRKISASDVDSIRSRHATGTNAIDLAREYGLSVGHLYRILDLKRKRR